MEQWGRRLEGLEAEGTGNGQWGPARQWGGGASEGEVRGAGEGLKKE